MRLRSHKTDRFTGAMRVPGDKSISHRALMLGLLAEGETIISGLLESDDVMCTAAAVKALGADLQYSQDGLWRLTGRGQKGLKEPGDILDMGNSGTSARLLTGLIAGHPVTATLTGDQSLRRRPMQRVIDPLSQMGAQFLGRAGGKLPLTVRGCAQPQALNYRLPVASAQVKSAILLAALTGQGTSTLTEPRPTRDHTEKMLQHFNVDIAAKNNDDDSCTITLNGGQRLLGCAVDVPGDPSSAAFPAIAGCLVDGAAVTLRGIGLNKRRTGLYRTLEDMGAAIERQNNRQQGGEEVADILVRYNGPLTGVTVPAGRVPDMIDEIPALAVAAACASGTTHLTGLGELRVKESDRLAMMARGLSACGVNLEEGPDSLTIHGTGQPPAGGALIETAMDHRIAMSFLVLGMVSDRPIDIDDARHINTSFPNFTVLMNRMGASIEPVDDGEALKNALS